MRKRPLNTASTRLHSSVKRPSEANAAIDLPPALIAERMAFLSQPVLLQSLGDVNASAQFSILAAEPRWVFEARGFNWRLTPCHRLGRPGETTGQDPLRALATLLSDYDLANPSDSNLSTGAPFQGGLIGYIGYDIAPLIERLPRRCPRDSEMPDIRLGLYDAYVIVDHRAARATLHAVDILGEGSAITRKRLDAMRAAIERPLTPWEQPLTVAPTPATPKYAYLSAVARALEYIAAGDVFQVNLSQRFVASIQAESAHLYGLYERLTKRSPAPYAAYLGWERNAILSSSPECFYETAGHHIVTRPIKGTAPRGQDAATDLQSANQLRASAKDRAELTMIIDLERNDLGRVCEFGTVRVVEPYAVESFAQVHHLVSMIEGRLRAGVGPVDIVRAMHPGGSITGAPKIRAMEIIDELEPNRRGVYTGAIGYFSRGGRSAFNIAIRTMIVEGTRVTYQVGGGIVADSDPEAEYDETMAKGRGLFEALSSVES